MKRSVLLAASKLGYQTRAFDEAAAQLGIELVFATDRCHILEDPWRDRAIPVKFEDPAQSAREINRAFSGVMAVGDRPALLAAHVAAQQGLRFHPPAAVEAARNKFLARQRFAAAGLLTPHFTRRALDDAAPPAFFPCVLKPLGLSASRGVIRANDAAGFAAAFARIRKLLNRAEIRRLHDPADRSIQIEEYIPGREFALEGVARAGALGTLALFDKPDPLTGPFFEETIYVTPSREPDSAQRALIETAQRAIAALGFTDGPVHAEFRVNERGVWPLEIAARPIGGLCARALPGLEALLLRHALGEEMAGLDSMTQGASGVMMIPTGPGGVFRGVEGVDAALAVPGVSAIEITAKERQLFESLPEGASYLGFVFARGPSAQAVEAALRTAHAHLLFRFDAPLPVA